MNAFFKGECSCECYDFCKEATLHAKESKEHCARMSSKLDLCIKEVALLSSSLQEMKDVFETSKTTNRESVELFEKVHREAIVKLELFEHQQKEAEKMHSKRISWLTAMAPLLAVAVSFFTALLNRK